MITLQTIIQEARDLRSEQGENPEYDRALVELTNRLCGRTVDEIHLTEQEVLGR